jgi:hypothetical protein
MTKSALRSQRERKRKHINGKFIIELAAYEMKLVCIDRIEDKNHSKGESLHKKPRRGSKIGQSTEDKDPSHASTPSAEQAIDQGVCATHIASTSVTETLEIQPATSRRGHHHSRDMIPLFTPGTDASASYSTSIFDPKANANNLNATDMAPISHEVHLQTFFSNPKNHPDAGQVPERDPICETYMGDIPQYSFSDGWAYADYIAPPLIPQPNATDTWANLPPLANDQVSLPQSFDNHIPQPSFSDAWVYAAESGPAIVPEPNAIDSWASPSPFTDGQVTLPQSLANHIPQPSFSDSWIYPAESGPASVPEPDTTGSWTNPLPPRRDQVSLQQSRPPQTSCNHTGYLSEVVPANTDSWANLPPFTHDQAPLVLAFMTKISHTSPDDFEFNNINNDT